MISIAQPYLYSLIRLKVDWFIQGNGLWITEIKHIPFIQNAIYNLKLKYLLR